MLSMMLPSPCFALGMFCLRGAGFLPSIAVCVNANKKSLALAWQSREPFSYMFDELPACLLAQSK